MRDRDGRGYNEERRTGYGGGDRGYGRGYDDRSRDAPRDGRWQNPPRASDSATDADGFTTVTKRKK